MLDDVAAAQFHSACMVKAETLTSVQRWVEVRRDRHLYRHPGVSSRASAGG